MKDIMTILKTEKNTHTTYLVKIQGDKKHGITIKENTV